MNSRTLCLGILHFAEATGYEINKMVSEGHFSHFIEASYGSIYPALTKLTNDNLVTWREEQIPGNPPRKVYAITDAGRGALKEALMEKPRWDVFKSEYLFLNLFSEILPTTHLEEVRSTRIADLRAELGRLEDAKNTCDHPGSQFAIGYGLALTHAAIDYLQQTMVAPSKHESTVAAE